MTTPPKGPLPLRPSGQYVATGGERAILDEAVRECVPIALRVLREDFATGRLDDLEHGLPRTAQDIADALRQTFANVLLRDNERRRAQSDPDHNLRGRRDPRREPDE